MVAPPKRALLPLLDRKSDRSLQTQIEQDVQRWQQVMERRAQDPATPMNPQHAFRELSARLPEECILTVDSGSATAWYALHLQLRRGMAASLSGGLATMGCALPYAIGAKFAHPQRHVIALAGDGAMQMNGLNALITVARYWQRWGNPRLTVAVLNNRDLNFVTWEQRGQHGDPKYAPSQELPDFAYADFARMLGLHGFRVERAEDAGPTWEKALHADRPAVVELVVDANVPPLPPQVTRKQMHSYYEAIAKGDPDAGAIKSAIKQQSSVT